MPEIAQVKADGEISTEEKFAIVMAFFMGLFSVIISEDGDEKNDGK